MAEENQPKNEQPSETENSVWEYVIAAVGLIIVVGTVGLMFYRALIEEKTPPQLEIIVESQQPSGDGFLVRFRVKNTGSQTAAAVNIEGVLKKGDETIETASSTLTYSPARSERRGGVFFSKNPAQFDLQIRAVGYEEP